MASVQLFKDTIIACNDKLGRLENDLNFQGAELREASQHVANAMGELVKAMDLIAKWENRGRKSE